jgi:hypothetical protein
VCNVGCVTFSAAVSTLRWVTEHRETSKKLDFRQRVKFFFGSFHGCVPKSVLVSAVIPFSESSCPLKHKTPSSDGATLSTLGSRKSSLGFISIAVEGIVESKNFPSRA